jgi:hypothetical protein
MDVLAERPYRLVMRPDGLSGSDVTTKCYRQDLRVEPVSPARIRRVVAACLRCWGREALVECVAVCLTELLAVVGGHAGPLACVLTLEDTGDGVRLTVSEAGGEPSVLQGADWFAESGRGMRLVAEIADRFGSSVTAAGRNVWLQFRADGAEEAA